MIALLSTAARRCRRRRVQAQVASARITLSSPAAELIAEERIRATYLGI